MVTDSGVKVTGSPRPCKNYESDGRGIDIGTSFIEDYIIISNGT